MIVASLGFLSIRSHDDEEMEKKRKDSAAAPSYDSFSLTMRSLQVTFVDEREKASPIVEKFDIAVGLRLLRKVKSDVPIRSVNQIM